MIKTSELVNLVEYIVQDSDLKIDHPGSTARIVAQSPRVQIQFSARGNFLLNLFYSNTILAALPE